MLVKANQRFKVVKSARINERQGRVITDGILTTITLPEKRGNVDSIMVRYTGGSTEGEAENGAKFRIDIPALVKIAQLIEK